MGNTLLSFRDNYYEHAGSEDPTKWGLTIGGCESTWLADLVAAWLLHNAESLFRRTHLCDGIHRDDGIIAFDWQWLNDNIDVWLKNFQFHIDELCGSDDLKFTTSIWRPDKEDKGKAVKYNKFVEIVGGDKFPFPYLDLELFWNKRRRIKF